MDLSHKTFNCIYTDLYNEPASSKYIQYDLVFVLHFLIDFVVVVLSNVCSVYLRRVYPFRLLIVVVVVAINILCSFFFYSKDETDQC